MTLQDGDIINIDVTVYLNVCVLPAVLVIFNRHIFFSHHCSVLMRSINIVIGKCWRRKVAWSVAPGLPRGHLKNIPVWRSRWRY